MDLTHGIWQFNGVNFENWKFRVGRHLAAAGCWEVLTQTAPTGLSDRKYKNKNLKAQDIITRFIHDDYLDYIRDKESARLMWESLITTFGKKSQNQIALRQELSHLRLNDGEDMNAHFLKFDALINQLENAEANLEERDLVAQLFITLPKSYETIVETMKQSPENELALNVVKERLLAEEGKRMNDTNGEPTQMSPAKKKFHGKCNKCGKSDHQEKDCRSNQKAKTPLSPTTINGPTVFPVQNFEPVQDAIYLYKAINGSILDVNTLIIIICRRSKEQRQEIQQEYEKIYGVSLFTFVVLQIQGNSAKLLIRLLTPIVDFYSSELDQAIGGDGTDYDVLIEILCTLSNAEIHNIKYHHMRMYGTGLEDQIKKKTRGNFKRLLLALCAASRDESLLIDEVAAQNDVLEMLKPGALRVDSDENILNMILCQRNYQQLKLIFEEYERMAGHCLEEAIEEEFSGNNMEGLIAICKCLHNKAKFFAARLHKAITGIDIDDDKLMHIVITRSEIDMTDIKISFESMYRESLEDCINVNTAGVYNQTLRALIGEKRFEA